MHPRNHIQRLANADQDRARFHHAGDSGGIGGVYVNHNLMPFSIG
jgi:hypothetical protein